MKKDDHSLLLFKQASYGQTYMKYIFFGCFLLLVGPMGCQPKSHFVSPSLTSSEKKLCDSLQLDTSLIKIIRNHNTSVIEPFHYSLSKMYRDGKETELNPIYLDGVIFREPYSTSMQLVETLHHTFDSKGYSIFVLEQNFNLKNRPDEIAVLKTRDKFSILQQLQTDGANYNINNDSLLRIIKKFDDKYSLDLIGASGDWCEFIIRKEPVDWLAFAKEVYKVCPDDVDQGTNTIEALADEMKRTKHLYFWWD
jgi:hypothetical protein